jgi:hypothetical protein
MPHRFAKLKIYNKKKILMFSRLTHNELSWSSQTRLLHYYIPGLCVPIFMPIIKKLLIVIVITSMYLC